jgi:Trk K+ transport system NAD-binding subunit
MKYTNALIFGTNDYAKEIARNIGKKYERVVMFAMKESEHPQEEGAEVESFDLSDEWGELANTYDMENTLAFCALEDDAQNIFLTISLRAAFAPLTLVALAKNKESASKLTMAGANKVIPVVQTTADMIVDILERPVVSNVLHGILYEKSNLKIVQIEVQDAEYFSGQYPADIDWSRNHGIIVLSVIHQGKAGEFIYSSKAKHHAIEKGDIFVVVGYEEDLKAFEKLIGSRMV